MARPEVTGRKPTHLNAATDADAYSVDEFCARHRISVQLFYKNRKQMPRTFNVGARVLISKEAVAAWPRARAGDAGRRLTARAATVDLAVNAQDRNVPSGEPTAAEDVAGNQKTPVPQITLINKRDVPALMSTRIALDSAGKLVSDRSECLMVTGTAERAFARSASPGVSRRGNGGVSWAPVVEFAAGAKKAHAQFQRQTLEAIHAAAAAENAD